MGAANRFPDDTDPRAGVKQGGPDAASKDAKAKDPQLNAQRSRDGLSAGQRGSNHVGQGSDAATNPEKKPAGVNQAEHVRKGNSAQESFDKKGDQEMDMKLGGRSDEELEAIPEKDFRRPQSA